VVQSSFLIFVVATGKSTTTEQLHHHGLLSSHQMIRTLLRAILLILQLDFTVVYFDRCGPKFSQGTAPWRLQQQAYPVLPALPPLPSTPLPPLPSTPLPPLPSTPLPPLPFTPAEGVVCTRIFRRNGLHDLPMRVCSCAALL
jgi:hypothetical protein